MFLNPRSIASLKESGNTSPVAFPSGTLPEKAAWPEAALELLDWPELLDELLLYETDPVCGAVPRVGAWPNAGRQSRKKLTRTQGTTQEAKGILLHRKWLLGLKSFIDD